MQTEKEMSKEIKTEIVYLTKTENETLSDFLTICWYLLVVPRDAVIVMQKPKNQHKKEQRRAEREKKLIRPFPTCCSGFDLFFGTYNQ